MIKVFTGPMFSGKSDELLKEYDKKYHKSKILLSQLLYANFL